MSAALSVTQTTDDSLLQAMLLAYATRQPMPALPAHLQPVGVEDAYRIAQRLIRARGLTPRGYKIGANTAAAQQMLGLTEPLCGRMFAETVRHGQMRQRIDGLRIGLEIELVLRLGVDLTGSELPRDAAPLSAVEAVHLGIEINEPPYADPLAAGGLALIAANGAHAGLVLGPPQPAAALDDLMREPLLLRCDGRDLAGRTAREAGVDPLAMLGWLARHCERRGSVLTSGALVATGAIVACEFAPAAMAGGETVAACTRSGPLATVQLGR